MRLKNLRWWIVGLLFCACALNYMDRYVLSTLEPKIQEVIGWSPEQWGLINATFLLAYTLFGLVTGRLVDKLGTKVSYLLILGWWGAACGLHGFATSVTAFVVLRFALGMGEAGLVPATAKACAEWFPPRERGFAYSLAATGMSIGGIITPPLCGIIAVRFGWQSAFFFTGGLCIFWLVAWQWLYGSPKTHRFITETERQHIQADAKQTDEDSGQPSGQQVGLVDLLRLRPVWGMALARFLGDPVWFFLSLWIPKYMSDVRHIEFKTIAYTSWTPFMAAGIASLVSGSLSSYLMKRGIHAVPARKVAIVLGAIVMPIGTLAFYADHYVMALGCLCVAAFGHFCWVTATQTLPGDIFPARYVGTVTGSAQMTGALGAMLGQISIGWVVVHYGYQPVFIIAGLMHPIATVIIFCTMRHTDRMRQRLLEQEREMGELPPQTKDIPCAVS